MRDEARNASDPGRKAVGVDADHWKSNILFTDTAEFDIDAYLTTAAGDAGYNLKEKLEQWRELGVVVLENSVDVDLIEALLADVEYLSEHRSQFDLEVEHKGVRHRLGDLTESPLTDTGVKFNCLENISLAARQLSLTPSVCDFLGHVFQDAPVVIQSLTFWRGSEQPAHLDYPWVRIQTKLPHLAASWIPLEDIHPDAGPLAYYPGSHRHGLIPPFDWGNGSLVQEPDSTRTPADFVDYLREAIDKLNLSKAVFLPKRGDVLIWHGNVLHEGTPVKDRSRTRRSYVTHYTSLGAYPSDFHYPDALAAGRYTGSDRGYVFDHPWVKDDGALPSWERLPR